MIKLDFVSKSQKRGLIIEKWLSNKINIRTLRKEVSKVIGI